MGRPTLTPGAMGDEGHDPAAEYLCTLQPRGCTRLADELGACRRRCTSELGQDQTGLYPLHVSVTGFFRATRLQLVQARSLLSELFSAGARNLHIEGHKIVVTSDGYVLIDVHAPGVAELARVFASRAADIGMHVRPKDVRHLSLASGRSPEEQLRVKEFFSGVPLGAFGMDLVLARLVRRASVPEASAAAAAHDFVEEATLPRFAAPTVQASDCARILGRFVRRGCGSNDGARGRYHPCQGSEGRLFCVHAVDWGSPSRQFRFSCCVLWPLRGAARSNCRDPRPSCHANELALPRWRRCTYAGGQAGAQLEVRQG